MWMQEQPNRVGGAAVAAKEGEIGGGGSALVDPWEVRRVLAEVRARPMIARVLTRLRDDLPKNLFYHAVEHTEDVLAEVVLFALQGQVSPDDLELLAIAAAFHDAGYIERYVDNEVIGARMARAAMEAERLSGERIAAVERMVLDTRLVRTSAGPRQIATTGLSKYLLDADLSNFGRADFFDKGELQRRELGIDRERFLRRTFALISSHSWQTDAARTLRQPTKEENLRKLGGLLQSSIEVITAGRPGSTISTERLAFLARLPLLLNSSLDTRMVLTVGLRHLKESLEAEAATIFTLNESKTELTFWALEGGAGEALAGRKMSARKGIVGWVIDHEEAVLVENAQTDQRFFAAIDQEAEFQTRSVLCAPLVVRGDSVIGAIQVLNRQGGGTFNGNDLMFLEQFSHQVALALDNAALFERINERTVALERVERERANALTVLAHEVRVPLNIIQTAAELLAGETPVDEAIRRSVFETFERGVQQLSHIVAELAAATNVAWRGGAVAAQDAVRSMVEVARLVHEVRRFFQPICIARQLALTVHTGEEPIKVQGDAGLLFVALKNLVSNAVRFTPDGGAIDITVRSFAGLVDVAVRDSGVGISPEQHRAVFERFFEVGSRTPRGAEGHAHGAVGLGLGLSTAQTIARQHGGSIEIASEPGHGSVFTLRLPGGDGVE
jgi:signal transduction histidine kinase